MRGIFLGLLVMGFFSPNAFAAVKGEEVTYKAGNTEMKGYLAYDDSSMGERPGVIVVHEWWGNNDYSRKRADMLAQLGYVALAIDMYGKGKTANNPQDAGRLSGEIYGNPSLAQERFLAGLDYLKGLRLTDPTKVGAIGYCFGGKVALDMALRGADLNGVVSFHASLPTMPADFMPGDVRAKVLVCHGGADSFIEPQEMTAFKSGLDKARVDYQVIVYPDSKHAFTNPQADQYAAKFNIPVAYNAAADQKSWEDMRAFFKKVFSS